MPLIGNALNFDPVYRGKSGYQQSFDNANVLQQQRNRRDLVEQNALYNRQDMKQRGVTNALNREKFDATQQQAQAKITEQERQEGIASVHSILNAPKEYQERMYNELAQGGQPWAQGGEQALTQIGYQTGWKPEKVDPYKGYPPELIARMSTDPNVQRAITERDAAKGTAAAAGSTNITNILGSEKLTPLQNEIDKKYATSYVDWRASGGAADVIKQLDQLREVSESLGTADNLTGPVIGSTPDMVQKFVNPESLAARDTVEEVVQRNLRVILGAQFTEKEGVRLIARAYNINLNEAENKKRVDRLIKQIESAAFAKDSAADYAEENGTLRGWKGTLPKTSDFFKAVDGTQTSYGVSGPASRMSDSELKKQLGL